MTVQYLINQLKMIKDKKQIVVMSKDSEGNGFSPLADVCQASYVAHNTWSGDVPIDETKGVPAIVLWPTN